MAHRDVKVGWRAKALAFNVFDRVPFGENLYYFMQKNITHTVPRKLVPTAKVGLPQTRHIHTINRYRSDLDTLTLLEIGAGWDLYANLLYYCMGLNHQIAIDIRRWAHAEAINAIITYLQKDPPEGYVRVPRILISDDHLEKDLLENYGIRYMAPFDARDTKLPSGSIDVITTTSVFEHIPADACDGIIKEFRRIIHKDGLMSHTIDYSDHYAHADPNISDYNYLRYNDSQWKIFNPSIHYQNRLRTADYDKMFAANGFKIVEAGVWSGSEDDLNQVPISQTFKDMDRSALLELGCHYVVQPIADENPSSSNGLI